MPVPAESGGYLEFVYLSMFERTADGVVTDEEMKAVEDELLEDAKKGSVQGERVVFGRFGWRQAEAGREVERGWYTFTCRCGSGSTSFSLSKECAAQPDNGTRAGNSEAGGSAEAGVMT